MREGKYVWGSCGEARTTILDDERKPYGTLLSEIQEGFMQLRRSSCRLALLVTAALLLPSCALGHNQRATPIEGIQLRNVADYSLPGDTSRFDYVTFDPNSQRLYIAHLGASEVIVFDVQQAAVISTIPGIAGVHGVLAVPGLGRIYATATDVDALVVIDGTSLAVIATVPVGDFPDGLAYAPEPGAIYVSDKASGSVTVVDTRTNQVVTTIALGDEVGNTQYDPTSRQIYSAVNGPEQLVAIDPGSNQVSGRYDLRGCKAPHGLLIDPDRELAFVACEDNATLVVVDLTKRMQVATAQVGDDPDVLAFDPQQHQLYVAAESGVLTVFVEDDASLVIRQVLSEQAGPNAHSIAVDPLTHHAFLPLKDVDGRPVLREVVIETSAPSRP